MWEAWVVTYRGTLVGCAPTFEAAKELVFDRFSNISMTLEDTFWNEKRSTSLLIVSTGDDCHHAFVLSKQSTEVGPNVPMFASDLLNM